MNDNRITARETQRVIKFRAWDIKLKMMHENVECYGVYQPILPDYKELFFQDFILDKERFALLQWSGLLDKHGKEIYEGDLLVIDDDKEHPVLVVFGTYSLGKDSWGINNTTTGFFLKYPDGSGYNGLHNHDSKLRDESHYGFAGCEVEVIGDIYTTPHLVDPKMIER